MRQFLISSLFLLSPLFSYGQAAAPCDTIYQQVDQHAKFGEEIDIVRYFLKEVLVENNCLKQQNELVGSLRIKFTIDASGKVIAADFVRPPLTESCQAELRAKLFSMPNWTPAYRNGKAVCSYFTIPISCIKLQ